MSTPEKNAYDKSFKNIENTDKVANTNKYKEASLEAKKIFANYREYVDFMFIQAKNGNNIQDAASVAKGFSKMAKSMDFLAPVAVAGDIVSILEDPASAPWMSAKYGSLLFPPVGIPLNITMNAFELADIAVEELAGFSISKAINKKITEGFSCLAKNTIDFGENLAKNISRNLDYELKIRSESLIKIGEMITIAIDSKSIASQLITFKDTNLELLEMFNK